MREPRTPQPVMLIVALFSRFSELMQLARERLQSMHGPILLESEPFHFNQTRYYEKSMGVDLQKQFLVFENLIDPGSLPEVKINAIRLERELAQDYLDEQERPINLDPGILSLGKWMLATTKDQSHRIYLRDGIYAEVTLHFRNGAFEPWPWTYADYRQESVQEFLREAREHLYRKLRS